MAVEIPVVIDIDKAFQDAAERVNTAIRPLKQNIEKSTADLKFTVGFDEYEAPIRRTLSEILTSFNKIKNVATGPKYSIDQLNMALSEAETRLANLIAIESSGGTVNLMRKRELEESIVLLTTAVEQRRHDATLVERQTMKIIEAKRAEEERNYVLSQEAKTMGEINARLEALRGKLNTLDPRTAEWTRTAKEIANATAQMQEFDRAFTKATTKPGSINRISSELQALEQRWASLSKAQKFDADGNLKKSAQKIVDQYKTLTEEARKYGKTLSETVNAGTQAFKQQGVVLRQLQSYASMYFSIFGLFRFVKQIRDVTGELEFQRVALGHLIQDEEYGAKLFERIKAAAIESPFRIKDLVTYTKQLAAYRLEQEELFDTTQRLADMSAGLGVSMDRLILAYGQVRAASVLRGQELRQFTEAGVPLVELLAEKFTELTGKATTTADVFKLISQRAVPFSMIAEIFEDLTDKGGMFFEMQERQAETLKGRWEKLKDAFDIGLQSIGDSKTFRAYNDLLLNALTALAKNLRLIPKLLEGGTVAWATYSLAVALSTKSHKAEIAAEVQSEALRRAERTDISRITVMVLGEAKARDLLTKAYAKQAIASGALSKAFWRLTAAMLSNPISAIIAGLAALGAIFFTFRKSVNNAADALSYLDDTLESISVAEKEYNKSGGLIDKYEKLAQKTDRTAAENQKLYQTIEKLRDIYPELAAQIDSESDSLENQIALLKDAREERKKQAQAEAEAAYNTALRDLEDATAKQAQLEKDVLEASQQQQNYEYLQMKASERYWRKQTEKRQEQLNAVRADVEKLQNSLVRLDKVLRPSDADNRLAQWQKQVKDLQSSMLSVGDSPVFTDQEIEEMTSVYDLFGKLKKRVKDLTESLQGMREAFSQMTEGDAKTAMGDEIKGLETTLAVAEAITKMFGFVFSKSGAGTKTDPFVTQMQERLKFMQDFKKGYDDLSKYLSSQKALAEQSEIMLGRGLAINLGSDEQKRAATDLSQWYSDMIDQVQNELRRRGIKGLTVTDFLGIDTSKKSKAVQDLQKLLQQIWDAKTDFDTAQKKKDLEDALKRLSEEIKQTEVVRNFYDNILDLTGDTELASTMSVSVYGGIGQDFKSRMQRQLNEALKSMDPSLLTEELSKAIESLDYTAILQNIDALPEEWRKRLQEMAEAGQKFNADRAAELVKALQKAKTYGEQRVQLARETARRMAEIAEMNVPQPVKDQLQKQNRKKEAEEAAKMEYEAFKDTPMYIELFADLDEASVRMLRNMRDNLISLRTQWKDLTPTELKELQSRINELDEQIASRNPFQALIESIKEYQDLQQNMSRARADQAAIDVNNRLIIEKELLDNYSKQYDTMVSVFGVESQQAKFAKSRMLNQADIVDETIKEADAAQEIASQYRRAAKHIMDAAEGLQKWAGYVGSALDGAKDIVDAFGSEDFSESFGIIAEGTVKTLQGAGESAIGLAKILTGTDIAGGIMDLLSGMSDLIVGIGGTAKKLNIQQLNKEIKEQARLIANLEESYDSLSKSLDRAFGNDRVYNFNQMMEIMAAEAEAYRKQAEAERAKGKKADEDTALGYERSARELDEKMRDLREQQDAFFAGADLAAAAESFADAWLSAYQEFGDTSTAIEERMTEMVQTLMKKAALSGIAQSIMGNWYESLADVKDWNAQTIATKWKEAMELVNPMVEGMQVFANAMQSEGVSLRNTVGQFTGISRDIAGASEESINGLAAGINTQNFYMSFMPLIHENVAQILTYITGGNTVTPATQTGIEGMPSVQKMVFDHLPYIDANINSMLQILKSVVSPKSAATATHYVSIK